MLIDLHLHTRRSKDSSLTIPDAVEEARQAGVDAMCITDHGRFTSEQELLEMTERYDMIIFGGAEFSTGIGHFLVYDVPNTDGWTLERDLLLQRIRDVEQEIQRLRTMPFKRLESLVGTLLHIEINDLLGKVHRSGGVVVWAHPMDDWSQLRRWFNRFSEIHGTTDMHDFAAWLGDHDETSWWPAMIRELDGIEILNGAGKRRGVCNALARQVAEVFGKPGVAGSDAHHRHDVARVATRFDVAPAMNLRIGDLLRTASPSVEILKPFPNGDR